MAPKIVDRGRILASEDKEMGVLALVLGFLADEMDVDILIDCLGGIEEMNGGSKECWELQNELCPQGCQLAENLGSLLWGN